MKKYLILVLLLGCAMLSATAVQPSGSGTEASPYQITSLDNLQWIYENENVWNKWFIQINDIDASATSTWNSGAGWMPLGYRNSSIDHEYFEGSYDGQGHSITSLTINRPAGNNQGFFGYVSGATISNLILLNVNIQAYNTVGALIGNFLSGTVTNCCATGSVAGNNVVGGLIGDKRDEASCCYSACAVTGSSNIGGFAGNNSSTLYNCYAIGNVSGTSYVGGLVGGNFPGGDIQDSYSVGSVIGSMNTGGLVGYNNASVATSFWNTQTSGQSSSAGGTGKTTVQMKTKSTYTDVGWDFTGETANGSNDYWSIDGGNNSGYPYQSWQSYSAFISVNPSSLVLGTYHYNETSISGSLTVSNSGVDYLLINSISFAVGGQGFSRSGVTLPCTIVPGGSVAITVSFTKNTIGDFNDTLVISSNAIDNPTLEIPVSAITRYNVGDTGMLGLGTETFPLQIADFDDLLWISSYSTAWNAWFIQTANIDASPTQDLNDGAGWIPIGSNTTAFSGRYNGQDYIIDNLYINRPDQTHVGLFGKLSVAIISNLGLKDAQITGDTYSGGLAGYTNNSSIQNCHITGAITGGQYCGGLLGGVTNFSAITECYSMCSVCGDDRCGGLIGMTDDHCSVYKSYSISDVEGSELVGGLIGLTCLGSTISECFSSGTVSAEYICGGLVGRSLGADIDNCYSASDVDGIGYAGGLVGSITNGGITDCYSTGAVDGTFYIGGLIGENIGGEVTNSFWDVTTSGQSSSEGGTGKTTAQMTTQSTYTNAGWDFEGETENGTEEIWNINSTLNDGYPYLSWQEFFRMISFSDIEFDFGGMYIGQAPLTATLTIANTGTIDLIINQLGLQYGNRGFGISEISLPMTLEPNQACSILISFDVLSTGNKSDAILIESNADNTPSLNISLTGSGTSSAPLEPANVQLNLQGNDAIITWGAVTQNEAGQTITPDGYVILYSETPDATEDDYLFLTFTIESEFTHARVVQYSDYMFYMVETVIDTDATRTLRDGDSLRGTRWGDVKNLITR